MADKKNFMLRLNAEMYKALEKWAADEFRSVNGQIEFLLSEALKNKGRPAQIGSQRNIKKNEHL